MSVLFFDLNVSLLASVSNKCLKYKVAKKFETIKRVTFFVGMKSFCRFSQVQWYMTKVVLVLQQILRSLPE